MLTDRDNKGSAGSCKGSPEIELVQVQGEDFSRPRGKKKYPESSGLVCEPPKGFESGGLAGALSPRVLESEAGSQKEALKTKVVATSCTNPTGCSKGE